MIDPFTAAAIGGTISSVIGGLKSGKAAKKAGKRNARAILAEAAIEREQEAARGKQEIGLTKAAVGASGVQRTGSSQAYLDTMEGQLSKRLDWISESAKRRARIAKKGGAAQASSAKWGALSSGLLGLSGLMREE